MSLSKICSGFSNRGVHLISSLNLLSRSSLSKPNKIIKFLERGVREVKKCKESKRSPIIFKGLAGISILSTLGRSKFVARCDNNHLTRNRVTVLKSEDEEHPFNWRLFLSFLCSYIGYLIAAIAMALAVAIVNIQIPLQLGKIVNVISEANKNTDKNILYSLIGPAKKMIGYYIVQGILTFSYITCIGYVGESVANDLRKDLFHSIINQDISFFDERRTGQLVDRLTSDVQEFKSTFKLCISQGIRCITQIVGCSLALWKVSSELTLTLGILLPTLIGIGTGLGSVLRKLSKRAQNQVSKATGVADEAISNIRTVRAFAMEHEEERLYERELDLATKLSIKLGFGIGILQGLSNITLNGVVLGTLMIGGYLMSQNKIDAGDLMSFLVASQTIQKSLTQLLLLSGQTVRGYTACGRVFQYLELPSLLGSSTSSGLKIDHLQGKVIYDNVTFSYPSRKEAVVLRNLNVVLPAGKMVALCGLSGSGKSTIASLLERFYDVDEGSILIDNENIKDLDPKWLRRRAIGYISQEPVLFATSVRENIRYGRPEASDEEVEDASKKANAHPFISEFPEGYDTILGEKGQTVSGGQKQRIAIARALLKDPAILILDEATSALDTESERIVQEALDKAVKGRTVLVIAHRLTTIRNADIIHVLSKGEIVESGNYESLIKKRGVFWELMQRQNNDSNIIE
ncbi:DgyrCDS14180 [Dimorphilus gyrociliatus]|uniref:Mitochondrial potassium channel ATP-binding subunit n=1 Tax=Dimorphilus gyrociliatus TaxID=2664684 RepID=A0A7I8WD05_9ANNE|nr:DgyrCDS14180 [Dimorphilus gyrociliatus]